MTNDSAFRTAFAESFGGAGFGTNKPPMPLGSPVNDSETLSVKFAVPVINRLFVIVEFGTISQIVVSGMIPKSGISSVMMVGSLPLTVDSSNL
jgi:hypothetical protein